MLCDEYVLCDSLEVQLNKTPSSSRTFASVYTQKHVHTGSFYCLFWRMHGHTLSDYASSDVRTREPQRTLRAIGLLKGRGSNWLTYVMSQLAANEDGE